ncbi:zinc knuckle CX2CX4HX4C containing protein [Tanacetum coccineum]
MLSSKGRKIPKSPWGSPIPIGDEDGDVKQFSNGDGDRDRDEAHKRGWGWQFNINHSTTALRSDQGFDTSKNSTRRAMAGIDINTLTMEQYLALSQENQAPGVVKPEIRGNVNFEIKSQFMRELREDTFSENKNEDAHDHVDQVLNIGPIPGMTPTQALTTIQTMTDHSQKWHDGTSSRNVSNNSDTNGLAAVISKLDNLGCDMKKLKENVHAIQVGCQIYEGPHIDKECHLNEEVKQVEEVKYGEFRYPAPFNESNGAKFYVGPLGYYTRTNNRPPYGEKRLSLEKLMNKHQEESAQRSAQMDEWIKKLQENAEINTRNQSTPLKNLETKIEQLTKELKSKTTNEAPSSSNRQCRVVDADHEMPNIPISSRKLNNLHEVSFLSDSDSQVAQINKEITTEVLQCKLPLKEQNPRNFTLPCTIGDFKFYAMTNLEASANVMPRGIFEFLKLTNLRKTNMLIEMADMTKKAPLRVVENILVGIDKFLFPSDFVIINRTLNETIILGRPLSSYHPCQNPCF